MSMGTACGQTGSSIADAETVSAYARFNCTARYDAASDEYIVVVLYG